MTAQHPEVMTPREVADLFRVDPKTVSRWAKEGRIESFLTLGGHHRFLRSSVDALLDGNSRWDR